RIRIRPLPFIKACKFGRRKMVLRSLGTLAAVCLATAACLSPVNAFAQNKESSSQEVDMQWAVKVPMRDGVALNATVLRPHAQKEGLPVIFTLTPYIGDSYLDRAMYFARHGYVYALVDVRGRGNSAGNFAPFEND